MFIHPKYKSGNGFDWDICLVKVTNLTNAKPSNCNNCFGAACLPRELPDLHGRHCWVAGWGLNKEGGSGRVSIRCLLDGALSQSNRSISLKTHLVNTILNEVGVNLFSKVFNFHHQITVQFIGHTTCADYLCHALEWGCLA